MKYILSSLWVSFHLYNSIFSEQQSLPFSDLDTFPQVSTRILTLLFCIRLKVWKERPNTEEFHTIPSGEWKILVWTLAERYPIPTRVAVASGKSIFLLRFKSSVEPLVCSRKCLRAVCKRKALRLSPALCLLPSLSCVWFSLNVLLLWGLLLWLLIVIRSHLFSVYCCSLCEYWKSKLFLMHKHAPTQPHIRP